MKAGPELTEALLKAAGYREFIAIALGPVANGRRANFAAFARRAGFTSRSFPRDVVAGTRRITATSLPRLSTAGSGRPRAYFEALVAREEPEAMTSPGGPPEPARLEAKLERLRARLRARPSPPRRPRAFSRRTGSAWRSTPRSERARKGEPRGDRRPDARDGSGCRAALEEMERQGLVRADEPSGRFHPTESQLVLREMGGSNPVREYYLESLEQVRRQAREDFGSESRLFLNSVFSVDSRRAPELKRQLRELLEKFSTRPGAARRPGGPGAGILRRTLAQIREPRVTTKSSRYHLPPG